MDSLGIGGWTILAGLGAMLVMVLSVMRSVRRHRAARAARPPRVGAAPEVAALAAAQADLAARLDVLAAGGASEERLQAMASQLVGLIRDKNATLETALAGLDRLRERMRVLEQMGEPAEARALLERLEARLDELRAGQVADAAALEVRLAALEAPGESPVAVLAERLSALHAQKDALAQSAMERIARLEQAQAAHDPAALAKRLSGRLDDVRAALEARLAAIEDPAARSAPFGKISEQLTRLYAQKDASVEAMLGRLAPLEARIAEIDGALPRLAMLESTLAAQNPKATLDRLVERLAAAETAYAASEARLTGEITALKSAENPFAEISEQLTRLYAQKDTTVETVFARLAPLEAKLAEMETRDPQAALDGFAARLEGMQSRLDAPVENPFAEISEQLTRLYAQKDTTVETVFARLAPLEAKLAEMETRDPQAALDGFAARLEGMQSRLDAPVENPFAEISEQLTRLYAQKDTTVETVFARLAPLEAKLAEMETRDPQAALDGFAARLEGMQARLDAPVENPFAEISEQLTRLYAQKDTTVETVFARLAPLEAKLAEMETRDPQGRPRRLRGAARGHAGPARRAGGEPLRGDLRAAHPALCPEGHHRRDGLRPARAAGGEARRNRRPSDPQGRPRRLRGAARGLAVAARRAGGEPLRGDLRAAHPALCPEGHHRRDRLRPARAAGGEARRNGDPRSASRPRRLRGAARGHAGRLDAPVENPFAEISEQLTRLYAQKDTTVETRLRPPGTARGEARRDRGARPQERARRLRLPARDAAADAGRGGGGPRGAPGRAR